MRRKRTKKETIAIAREYRWGKLCASSQDYDRSRTSYFYRREAVSWFGIWRMTRNTAMFDYGQTALSLAKSYLRCYREMKAGGRMLKLQELVKHHQLEIGKALIRAREITEANKEAECAEELNKLALQIARRFGILSGLLFAFGVLSTDEDFETFKNALGISDTEMNDYVSNALDDTTNVAPEVKPE